MVKRRDKKVKVSNITGTYFVFLGYQFKSTFYDQTDILNAVEEAVALAEDALHRQYPRIRLKLYHKANIGEPLNKEIISLVKRASAAIFEVSEKNVNVYFEMGLSFISREIRPILLINKKLRNEQIIASDVRDVIRLPYRKLEDKTWTIAKHIKKEIINKITRELRSDEWRNLREIWSGGILRPKITIVCPELPKNIRPTYAQESSIEFVNLARFGDQDALVEILRMLPKLLPDAEVNYVTYKELRRDDREGNLILIGGPDYNPLSKKFMSRANVPFQYCWDGEDAYFVEVATNKRFVLKRRVGRHCVREDFGLFTRFPNPWNEENAVIMIGGLQTFGVLGAVKAFSMSPVGKKNTRELIKRIPRNPYFAVLIPVYVVEAQPSAGRIDITTLRTYPWV